jgi:uncharacterized membrane protein
MDVRIILSGLWIAVEFLYQHGDTLRLYSGDFKPGSEENITGGIMSQGTMWMVAAITMTIPVVMIVLSLTLPYNANRWANIIIAIFYFLYTLTGVFRYPSAYDRFLLIVTLLFNALTVCYAWNWV